jgi:hypothetical protein
MPDKMEGLRNLILTDAHTQKRKVGIAVEATNGLQIRETYEAVYIEVMGTSSGHTSSESAGWEAYELLRNLKRLLLAQRMTLGAF